MKARAIETPKRTIATNAVMLKAAAVGILSFILMAAKIFGIISPFGIAFLAALPTQYTITAIVGLIISCFLFAPPTYMIYYIIVLSAVFAAKILIHRLGIKANPIFLSLMCFAILATLSVGYTAISSSVELDFPMMLIEAVLAGTLTFFYAVCSSALLKRKNAGVYSYTEIASMVILFIAIITALCSIELFNINLGVIAGVVSIYLCMGKYSIFGASVSSIVVAIAISLYSVSMLEFSGLLIISSFIAGIFSPLKKFAQMSAFIAVSTFGLFILGAPIVLTYRIIEIFFATAVYVLVPQKVFTIIKAKTSNGIEALGSTLFQSSVTTKLNFASETILDLQNDLLAVSKRFSSIDINNIATVYEVATSRVCRGCSMQLGCWDKNYSESVAAFMPLNKLLRDFDRVHVDQMPIFFKEHCCKLNRLAEQINECYRAFTIKEGTRRHVEEIRGLVVEQFRSISDMLLEVSEEFSEISGYDEQLTLVVIKAFTKIECEPNQVICAIDRFGRSCIEIYTTTPIKTSAKAICIAICEATDKDLDIPSISVIGESIKIALFEKATYTVDFHAQQSCCNDNSICGDSYEYFLDAKGYAYCILSDGMGSGKRAAVDSVMTCSILLKLIKAGFGLESAIKLINSSLLVKSTDESLATIDIAKIDLYTGGVEFLKAGAATSFLSAKGSCSKITSCSLPVGIIQGIEFERKTEVLRDNDFIVLVSDGATAGDEEWILSEMRRSTALTARDLSIKLIYEAKQRQLKHPDDITILVAKLQKGV